MKHMFANFYLKSLLYFLLWVELTGGIGDENGWKVDAVGFQQAVERLVVVLLPDRVTIGGEH